MEKSEINIAQCIAEAFQQAGYSVELSGDFFVFNPLGLKFDATIDQLDEAESGLKSSRLKIQLSHQTAFPNTIFEYVYGWGETYQIATIHAFERWIHSDFPVFHDWLADHKTKDQTTEVKALSHSSDGDKVIPWKGVIGPLLHFDGKKLYHNKDELTTVYQALFDDLTADLFDTRGIYPIKCFMSKSAEGKIDIDCRLNGEEWEKGRQSLFQICKEWEDGVYQYWKQYMVIYDLEDDSEHEGLKAGLWKEVNKNRWWKFWKKGK